MYFSVLKARFRAEELQEQFESEQKFIAVLTDSRSGKAEELELTLMCMPNLGGKYGAAAVLDVLYTDRVGD